MIELRWHSERLAVLDADLAMCCEFGGFDAAAIVAAAATPAVFTTAEEFHRAMLWVTVAARPDCGAGDAVEHLRSLVEASTDEPFTARQARQLTVVFDDALAGLGDQRRRAEFEERLGATLEEFEWRSLADVVDGTAQLCRLAARDGYLLLR